MAAKGPTRKMRRRIFIVVVPVIAIMFVALLARICVISVVDSSFYQSKACLLYTSPTLAARCSFRWGETLCKNGSPSFKLL